MNTFGKEKTLFIMADNYSKMAERFFDKTYRDAFFLLQKTKEYVRFQANQDLEVLSPVHALKVSNEILRVTARLTQIMSCLLAQKAAYKGEISFEEALSDKYKLPTEGPWVFTPAEENLDYFPSIVVILLSESLDLYKRVLHLNNTMYVNPSKK
jgi:regulator of CtrA degradation